VAGTRDTATAPALTTSADDKTRRLGLPVTVDGRLDVEGLDGMRGSTREAIRKALTADPAATAKLLGQPLGTVAKAPEFVTLDRAGRVYDLVSGVLQNTIGRRYPDEIAREALTYSDADKAVLAPSTAAVLNKYAGPFFSKYGDELELVGLLISLTWAKIALANTLLAAHERTSRGPSAVVRHPSAPDVEPTLETLTPGSPADLIS